MRCVAFSIQTACVLLAAVAAGLAGGVQAADPEFVGILALLDDAEVAKELGLSEAQRGELLEWIDDRELSATDLVVTLRDKPEDRAAKMAAFAAESEKLGLAKLSPAQQRKLKQIQIARAGMAGLADEAVRSALKLSQEQLSAIERVLGERQQALDEASLDRRRSVEARYEQELAALLTAQQRLAWERLAGKADEGAQIAAAANDGGDNSDDEDPPLAPPAAPQGAKPARAGVAPPAQSGAGAKGAAGSKAGDAADDDLPWADELPPDEPEVIPDDVKLRFNFRYAPWKTVLEWFAEKADLSLELTSTPPGTFNYVDRREYTPAEAIDLINSVLLTKGYTLLRQRRMLMVINLEDGIPPNLVETVPVDELDQRGKFELVSCLFPVELITPEDAEKEIRKLLGPQGSIVVLPKTGGLLVTETAGKLRVIRDLLKAAQKPVVPPVGQAVHEVPLKHALAEEVLVVIRQLMGLPEDRNAAPDGSLRIAVDALGTRLFVTGTPERVKQAMDILKLVDVSNGLDDGPTIIETPQLEVYTIPSADPESVLKVLQTLLAGQPDVRLDVDPKTGNLVALARPSQHATIKATIEQLERDTRQIEVIPLRVVDPQLAVLAINKLFGAGEEDTTGRAPKVDADPTSRQLLVRGSASQIAQIRSLLEKMGEKGFEEGVELAAADRGHVRMVPLTGAAQRAALDQLEQVWGTMRPNKIRIVTPSAAVREMRSGGRREDVLQPAGSDPRVEGLQHLFKLFEIKPRQPAAEDDDGREIPIPKSGSQPAAPASRPAAPKSSGDAPQADREARLRAQPRGPFQFAADRRVLAQADEPARTRKGQGSKAESEEPVPPPLPLGSGEKGPAAGAARPADERVSKPGAEIIVAPGPGGIMIASEDLEALDDFEMLLQTLASRAATGREYTVFYLKYARAEVAGELLNEILGGSSGGGESGGSLFGDLASAALGSTGGGLVGSLLGLGGGGGGGSITTSGTVTIVADQRLNALVVQANPSDLDIVEQLLEVIDQEASPEDVQTFAKPRLIPVFYTSAQEIADVVRQIYASRIAGSSVQANRQPSPEEFIRALRGGGGGGRRGSRSAQQEEQQITVGVDRRSNSLVVSAPEPLFQEIRLLVEQLDQAGSDEAETMRVVTIKNASPELVHKAVVSITGGKVTAGTSSTAAAAQQRSGDQRDTDQRSGTSARTGDSGQSGQPQTTDEARDRMRRQVEFFNMLQRGEFGGQIPGGATYEIRPRGEGPPGGAPPAIDLPSPRRRGRN